SSKKNATTVPGVIAVVHVLVGLAFVQLPDAVDEACVNTMPGSFATMLIVPDVRFGMLLVMVSDSTIRSPEVTCAPVQSRLCCPACLGVTEHGVETPAVTSLRVAPEMATVPVGGIATIAVRNVDA